MCAIHVNDDIALFSGTILSIRYPPDIAALAHPIQSLAVYISCRQTCQHLLHSSWPPSRPFSPVLGRNKAPTPDSSSASNKYCDARPYHSATLLGRANACTTAQTQESRMITRVAVPAFEKWAGSAFARDREANGGLGCFGSVKMMKRLPREGF